MFQQIKKVSMQVSLLEKDACGKNDINQRVWTCVRQSRDTLGLPAQVTSGCICEKNNSSQGGIYGSFHKKGKGAD